ncbi:MAG: hypothetical protein GXO47_09830 [Chlorobi bacterium]|nr:hypothetical protein [Chlorobiota bacterium]
MERTHFSYFFKEDAKWGEQEIVRFRWMLIFVIIIFIGYRFFVLEMKDWTVVAFLFASVFVIYNSVLNFLIKKYKGSIVISYFSSSIDILILSGYIYVYASQINPTAISTSSTILLYPVLIMFSVLRYNGKLVIYSTVFAIVVYNLVFYLVMPEVTPDMLDNIASMGWDGQVFRSSYLALMGYFMFSIPKMINRLMDRQMAITNKQNDTELKLALEKQKKKLAMSQLEKERALNEKLNEQSSLIKEQKEKLEEANKTKDRLFSIVGHDLRSPFSVQCSLTELLVTDFDGMTKEEKLEIINAINKTAHQGIGLLSNLLDWARTQNKSDSNFLGPVNVNKIINEAISLYYNKAKFKEIEILAECDEELIVFTDGNMVETLIRNLLSNAIKFSSRGGSVEVNALKKGNHIYIKVKDNGVGMTKEQVEKLFVIDKVTTEGTENEPGTGIGLMICKELVDKNNGSIEVSSTPGKGSEFTVKLPIFSNIIQE